MTKENPLPQLPDKHRIEARIAGLVVVGLLMFIFEAYIPRPIPWLKIGLANITTLIALYWIGWRAALAVALFRIIIGSFFTGLLFSPGFFLSISGGICAVLTMIALHRMRIFGILAISVAGAIMHNVGQLIVAIYLLFDNAVLWYIFPYLLLTAVITGLFVGWFSHHLLKRLEVESAGL